MKKAIITTIILITLTGATLTQAQSKIKDPERETYYRIFITYKSESFAIGTSTHNPISKDIISKTSISLQLNHIGKKHWVDGIALQNSIQFFSIGYERFWFKKANNEYKNKLFIETLE